MGGDAQAAVAAVPPLAYPRSTPSMERQTRVNLEELEADLPNGLHDSLLRALSTDLTEGRAELILDVWLGDLHSSLESERERRRRGRLELLGLTYLVVDDPDPRYERTEG